MMDKPSAADEVMSAMQEASALGVLYSAAVADVLGISPSDLECLDFVAQNGPVAAGQLAAATGLTTGAITGVIDRLARAQLVERDRTSNDRRKVLVVTTSTFREKVLPLYEPMQRLQAGVVEKFTETELRKVASFLALAVDAAREAIAELETRAAP